jgi:hypothetical protein
MERADSSPLSVPALPDDVDTLTAALAYAEAGWYLVPVRRGTKHPGSVLGDHWPALSSRDREVIVSWYAGTDHGIALHVGRSGAVVFDIDHPEKAPITLRSAEKECNPPTQRTRADQRRHLVFLVPPGRTLSNQRGKLGIGWGEVRGTNGVIIVAPSVHPDGGHYRWTITGKVPMLPQGVADMLPDAGPGEVAADSATVAEFARRHNTGDGSASINGPLTMFTKRLDLGDSRHEALVAVACWACREAQLGAYPAAEARSRLREAFVLAMAEAKGESRLLPPGQARFEFDGMWAWAVGQAICEEVPEEDLAPEPPSSPEPPAPEHVDQAGEGEEEWSPEELAARRRARLIAEQLEKLEISAEAKRQFNAKYQPRASAPEPLRLAELLALPDEEVGYRIDGLLTAGGRILLAAAQKAGKTTLMGNLIRCLADGGDFLGRHTVEPVDGTIILFDTELPQRTLKSWLGRQQIRNENKVVIFSLRDRVTSFNLTDPAILAEWAGLLMPLDPGFVILDCLRPVLDAAGLDEKSEAGRFLVPFGELLGRIGSEEAAIVQHMGHTGERARGDSGLLGWPDVNWKIVRKDDEEDRSSRFFSAFGRDVDVPECELGFNSMTGELKAIGGNRKDADARAAIPAILEVLGAAKEKLSGRQIEAELAESDHSRATLRAALKLAVAERRIFVEDGLKGARLHSLAR